MSDYLLCLTASTVNSPCTFRNCEIWSEWRVGWAIGRFLTHPQFMGAIQENEALSSPLFWTLSIKLFELLDVRCILFLIYMHLEYHASPSGIPSGYGFQSFWNWSISKKLISMDVVEWSFFHKISHRTIAARVQVFWLEGYWHHLNLPSLKSMVNIKQDHEIIWMLVLFFHIFLATLLFQEFKMLRYYGRY